MKWTKKMKGAGKKAAVTVTALGMVLTAFPPIPAKAAEEFAGQLTSVESVEKGSKDNIVVVKFNGGVTAQLTFLEDGIFRYNVDPSGEFSKYATPKSQAHVGRIQQDARTVITRSICISAMSIWICLRTACGKIHLQ